MLLGAFVAGIALGLAGGSRLTSRTAKYSYLHSHSGRHRFTNPLLDCYIDSEKLEVKELRPFKRELKGLVGQKIAAGDAQTVSVYLRNLDNGDSFGINSKELYNPASLLKVPLMMAWLKRAERDPTVLRRTFRYDGAEDLTVMQNIKPRETLRPGTSYTVDDLIFRMLAYSDNNAWWLSSRIWIPANWTPSLPTFRWILIPPSQSVILLRFDPIPASIGSSTTPPIWNGKCPKRR